MSLHFCLDVYVGVDGGKSQPFTVGFELRQGGVLSPILFIFCMNWIDSNNRVDECVPGGCCKINNFCGCLILIVLRLKGPSGKCAKLHTVAASNNRDHMPWSLFTHIPFVVNRTFNAKSTERLQQLHLLKSVVNIHLNRLHLCTTKREWNVALNIWRYYVSSELKPVHDATERQCTAAGAEV